MIIILGNVMNEGQNKLHTRLHQHHISCTHKQTRKVYIHRSVNVQPFQGQTILTVYILLVSLQTLNDAGVCLQTAFSQLIQIIHHIIIRL